MMRWILAGIFVFSMAAQAASEREVAEWVLRWEGTVVPEGAAAPIRNISELPAGDFHI